MNKANNIQIPQWEKKHLAIIDAGVTIFMKHGFEAASMDEVAKLASVSKRTVYDHFGNKENLFQAIITEHWNSVFEIDQSLFNNATEVAAGLTHFAKKFMKFLYQPKTIGLFRLLISESNRFPDLLSSLIINEKAPFTRELIIFLEQQSKNGKFKAKNIEMAAAFFMGMLKEVHFWPMMLGFSKLKQPKKQENIIKEAIEAFLKAYS